MLSYGVTGVLRDRRVPAWSLLVPGLRRNVPFVTPHCTVVLGCYPGVDGLRGGLDNVLRLRSDASGDEAVHLDAAADGSVALADETYVPVMKPLAPVVDVADELPGTEVAEPQYVRGRRRRRSLSGYPGARLTLMRGITASAPSSTLRRTTRCSCSRSPRCTSARLTHARACTLVHGGVRRPEAVRPYDWERVVANLAVGGW